jgi:hypothetical protein
MTVSTSEKTPPPNYFDLLDIVYKKNGNALSLNPYRRAMFPGEHVPRDRAQGKSFIRSLL